MTNGEEEPRPEMGRLRGQGAAKGVPRLVPVAAAVLLLAHQEMIEGPCRRQPCSSVASLPGLRGLAELVEKQGAAQVERARLDSQLGSAIEQAHGLLNP